MTVLVVWFLAWVVAGHAVLTWVPRWFGVQDSAKALADLVWHRYPGVARTLVHPLRGWCTVTGWHLQRTRVACLLWVEENRSEVLVHDTEVPLSECRLCGLRDVDTTVRPTLPNASLMQSCAYDLENGEMLGAMSRNGQWSTLPEHLLH